MTAPFLIIFDVDGTLIDSQAHIVASMERAFAGIGLPAPSRAATMSIVGLSLPVAMMKLVPDNASAHPALVEAYKQAFQDLRLSAQGASLAPLFAGAREMLGQLHQDPRFVLAVATGKSRRGMEYVLDLHNLRPIFASVQVADDHPSKPHPSMVETCLMDCAIPPERAVVVGDTVYDIEMARAAQTDAIGVSWGYHAVADLRAAGAVSILDRPDELIPVLRQRWSL
ncbi:HAD-IA family hydrolase [Rhodobacteraceae bacterium XHP0102]|nr:HAD-IA family hydrolase [Rhodobacteraceae bacterium XHP0102]